MCTHVLTCMRGHTPLHMVAHTLTCTHSHTQLHTRTCGMLKFIQPLYLSMEDNQTVTHVLLCVTYQWFWYRLHSIIKHGCWQISFQSSTNKNTIPYHIHLVSNSFAITGHTFHNIAMVWKTVLIWENKRQLVLNHMSDNRWRCYWPNYPECNELRR